MAVHADAAVADVDASHGCDCLADAVDVQRIGEVELFGRDAQRRFEAVEEHSFGIAVEAERMFGRHGDLASRSTHP